MKNKIQKRTYSFQTNLSRSYLWILMITLQGSPISPPLEKRKPSSRNTGTSHHGQDVGSL